MKNNGDFVLINRDPAEFTLQCLCQWLVRWNESPTDLIFFQPVGPISLCVHHLLIFLYQRLTIEVALAVQKNLLMGPGPVKDVASPIELIEHIPALRIALQPVQGLDRENLWTELENRSMFVEVPVREIANRAEHSQAGNDLPCRRLAKTRKPLFNAAPGFESDQ